jgi:tetratricopeptide (TPR) repeat protein
MPDNKTSLKQQTHIAKLAQWGGLMIACCLPIACDNWIKSPLPVEAKGVVREAINVKMPAQDIRADVCINSIEVRPFSSNQRNDGTKLAALVKNGIAKQGYIKVVNKGRQTTILTGKLTLGEVKKSKPYHRTQETKDERGRKIIKHTYHYRKQLSGSVTYALKKGRVEIASHHFTEGYGRTWTGQTEAEAKARAAPDEQIITSILNALARNIVYAISPHLEIKSFSLSNSGNHPGINLGIQYYKKRRYDQAEKYWHQVIGQTNESKDKASAHYNIGILKVREGKYAQAFERFRQADILAPGNDLYISALTKVEDAGRVKNNTCQPDVM